MAWLSGEFQAAESWLGESIKIGRAHGYPEELALALGLSGVVERGHMRCDIGAYQAQLTTYLPLIRK